MIEAVVTTTEMKNNFDKYLQMVINGNEVIIIENGKEIGRLIPKSEAVSCLTDSLTVYQSSKVVLYTSGFGR